MVRERRSAAPDPRPRVYLESSALLAGLLESDAEVIRSIDPRHTCLSALTLAEARRAVEGALHSGRITPDAARRSLATIAQLENACTVLDVSDTILARAGRRFPVEPVRTRDAIHLASAELIDDPVEPVVVLTRDRRLAQNARMMSLQVIGA